jgi:hypothetical protein
MRGVSKCLGLLLVGGLSPLPSLAAEGELLEGLEAGQYSVSVSGRVGAEATALPADNGDAGISDAELRAREAPERARYTGDTFYKPDSGASGPFEVSLSLGPDYVTMEGADHPALSVALHFAEGIEPGTYEVSDGFLDVGPNSVPVSVYVSAASADREQTFVFSWKVDGTVTLEQVDREAATGHFRFTANGMNRNGQVTDERVTVKGALRAIPFVPEVDLPGN